MSQGMSKGTIIGLSAAGFLALVTVMMIFAGVGLYNGAVKSEKGVEAQYEQNQNNLSQYSNKVAEAAQIPAMYRDDFSKVVTDALTGRYGKDGSQASFQWIKEHNIDFDSSMYTKIQSIIEAGRDRFEVDQKLLIDKKRAYETRLDTVPGGIVLRMLGFPKIDLDEFKIVKSGYSNEAFSTGEENGLKLR